MLDSTFLVDLVRGDAGARELLARAEAGSEALRVPAPAVARFWEALERSRHPPRDVARIEAVLRAAPGVAFTTEDAVATGRILGGLARENVHLDVYDAMVAALAVRHDESLATRNARDFGRVRGLRLVTY